MYNYKWMKCYNSFVIYKNAQIICYRRKEKDAIETCRSLNGI